jgi:hypothetical protein
VTGVFPKVSLDGGTHPGYFTVANLRAIVTDAVSCSFNSSVCGNGGTACPVL